MEETKRCPHCDGEILAVAKKCKHCGEWLDNEEEKPSAKIQVSCPVCGEQIDEGLDVCPICKEKISTNDTIVNSNLLETNEISMSNNTKSNWKKIALVVAGVLAAILIVVFISSKSSDNGGESAYKYDQETKDDIANVKEWLTNTYDDVLTGNHFDESKIRKYVTSSYYELVRNIVDYDRTVEGNGFFDYNFWTHCKGGSGWKMQIKDVLVGDGGLDGGKEYSATILLSDNSGTEKFQAVSLVKDNGDWRISNFQIDGASQLGEMRNYLRNAKEAVQQAERAVQESMNIWEGLYRTNEFGENNPQCPYIRAREIAPGTDMSVEIGKCDGMRFECTLVADDFTGAYRFAIKTLGNGEVFTFPFKEDHGIVYITDTDAINHIIAIMANGDYIISITRELFGETQSITAQVGIETKGIIDALDFLEK